MIGFDVVGFTGAFLAPLVTGTFLSIIAHEFTHIFFVWSFRGNWELFVDEGVLGLPYLRVSFSLPDTAPRYAYVVVGAGPLMIVVGMVAVYVWAVGWPTIGLRWLLFIAWGTVYGWVSLSDLRVIAAGVVLSDVDRTDGIQQ